ncbi:MAG: IS4 family transposase [Spirochaetales bacterium]|nr:IS4 family transposase [Spirochaetales bacterium]
MRITRLRKRFNEAVSAFCSAEETRNEYLVDPARDFTRKRKISLETLVSYQLFRGGGTGTTSLIDFFGPGTARPTQSAMIQRRDRIREGFHERLFHVTNRVLLKEVLYRGRYNLLACDGTDLNIMPDPADASTYCTSPTVLCAEPRGFSQLHVNALVNVLSGQFVDAEVQGLHEADERDACISMAERRPDDAEDIIIADRGYESWNLMAHLIRGKRHFVIRIRDTEKGSLCCGLGLPEGEFDTWTKVRIVRTYSKAIRDNPLYRFLASNSRFDFLPPSRLPNGRGHIAPVSDIHYHEIAFRVVRFRLGDDAGKTFEILLTDLSEREFPVRELKEIYHLRWGIETSFRELKYCDGLVNIHSRKRRHAEQEIFMAMIAHNLSKAICLAACRPRKTGKHVYVINYRIAAYVCRRFVSRRDGGRAGPMETVAELAKNLSPVRPDRTFERNVRAQSFVSFNYRAL